MSRLGIDIRAVGDATGHRRSEVTEDVRAEPPEL